MQHKKIPFSGPYASYVTTISSLSLQLMISTQFTDDECLNWENTLRDDLKQTNAKIVTDPILDRMREAPLFMLNELWSSSISSAVINFTSTTEHYVRDMIKLSLQRNPGLRKKAFSNYSLSALELEEDITIDEIKKRIFISIAAEKSKGELFSAKFKKASTFLSIDKIFIENDFYKSLDSIWDLRNTIAHTNKGFLKVFEIHSQNGILKLKQETDKADYLSFCVALLNIIDEFTKRLERWDYEVLEKWPASLFIK